MRYDEKKFIIGKIHLEREPFPDGREVEDGTALGGGADCALTSSLSTITGGMFSPS